MAKKQPASEPALDLSHIAPGLRPLAVRCDSLTLDPANARQHGEESLSVLRNSLRDYGQDQPLVVQAAGRIVRKGNGRLQAARQLGWEWIAAVVVDESDVQAVARAISDNRSAELSRWDPATLSKLLASVAQDAPGQEQRLGFSAEELARLTAPAPHAPPQAGVPGVPGADLAGPLLAPPRPTLAEQFLVPPFSVLDARQGYWQERKRQWLGLGIRSEVGRGENLLKMSDTVLQAQGGKKAQTFGTGGPGDMDEQRKEWRAKGGAYGHGAGAYDRSAGSPAARFPEKQELVAAIERGEVTWTACQREMGGLPDNIQAAILGFYKKRQKGLSDAEILADWIITQRAKAAAGESASHEGGLTFGTTIHPYDDNRPGGTLGPGRNGRQTDGACADGTPGATGTSIFDPVLCELAYRWLCPPGGAVLDPCAGGSVRGIVASVLGRFYTGIELRPEQVAANEEQAQRIVPGQAPRWVVGDGRRAAELVPGEYDLVFSCPPYADLERYSDDPADLSTMAWPEFVAALREIVAASCALLRPDRFACFVMGEVRDPKAAGGPYRGLVQETIRAFQDAGLAFYNNAILVTQVGSLSIRVGRQFVRGRKLGNTHQHVLMFVKGDPFKATEACGPVEVGGLFVNDEPEGEPLAPLAGPGEEAA